MFSLKSRVMFFDFSFLLSPLDETNTKTCKLFKSIEWGRFIFNYSYKPGIPFAGDRQIVQIQISGCILRCLHDQVKYLLFACNM